MTARTAVRGAFLLAIPALVTCGPDAARIADRTTAIAEAIRPSVSVAPEGDDDDPAPLLGRRRLAVGEKVTTDEAGRALVSVDTGAAILLAGDGEVVVTESGVRLGRGRAWIDVPEGASLELETEKGSVTARGAGMGVDVRGGRTVVYVAQGEALYRQDRKRGLVRAGQSLVLASDEPRVSNEALWDDWTGGLAVPGPREAGAEGVGEIYARLPDQLGEARWPLVVRSLDVRVEIQGDLAVTEVDQTFFNPASETVEGMYRIRTPEGALLQRFAVDRGSQLVDSVVKEQALAQQQYQEQVYAGSTEDPALLEWEAPDLYRARIYPIQAGASRRIVIRYAQWIGRSGEARTYRYPIGRGPRMQEMSIEVDLAQAGTKNVRANLGARVDGDRVSLYRSDYQPQADFWIDLFSEDRAAGRAWRAPHEPPLSMERQPDADEADYFFAQLFPTPERLEAPEALDVVLLVDLSAGTDATRLELARQFVEVVLHHLEEKDRLAVVAADLGMHGIGGSEARLAPADDAHKEAILEALAREPAGGATDLGAALADAAALLDPARPGAVVYVGDAIPTVGELELPALLARLGRLPRPPRLYGVAIGAEARLELLEGLVRGGGLAVRVEGRKEAAEQALRILSHLSRPVLTDVRVDLGSGIDRVYPRAAVSVVVGEPLDVVGRVREDLPSEIVVKGKSGGRAFEQRIAVKTETIADSGDLRLRWASERLRQLLAEGGGREAIAEVGTRYGLLTPFTSFYIPSASDLARDPELQRVIDLRREEEQRRSEEHSSLPRPYPTGSSAAYGCMSRDGAEAPPPPPAAMPVSTPVATTEANGEERPQTGQGAPGSGGSYGIAQEAEQRQTNERFRSADEADRSAARDSRGNVDLPRAPAPEPVAAAPSQPMRESPQARLRAPSGGHASPEEALAGDSLGEDFGAGGLGLRGSGRGGGGSGEGTIGLGNLNTIGRGGGGGEGSGYGRGAALGRDAEDALNREGLDVLAQLRGGRAEGPEATSSWWSDGTRFDDDLDAALAQISSTTIVVVRDDDSTPHGARRCSPASRQPLRSRQALWRERLQQNPGADGAMIVYRRARAACELPGWRDRRAMLSSMLGSAGGVHGMIAVFHAFSADPGTQAFLRTAILGRVRSAEDLRIVHQGIGETGGVDWTAVTTLLEKAPGLPQRVGVARDLLRRWPDDLRLKVQLFSLFEEAGEDRETRRLAAEIAKDPYADARARTLVGEFWLRKGDEAAAKRAWSEIVEFAPFDPYARRWLGDLYRSAGWHGEAYRQYETLATLTPDDDGVQILLASAAAGAGRIDEALRLEGRVASAAEPGSAGGNARFALLWSGVRLAGMRKEAKDANDADKLAKLLARANRSGTLREAGAVRAVLTWSHPDAGVELWTSFPGSPLARPEDLGTAFGIESWNVAQLWPGAMTVEIRQAGEPGLREVKAELILIWNEGKDTERVERHELTFGRTGRAAAFSVTESGASRVQSPWQPPAGGAL